VQLSRSRPWQKNDNRFAEQKNDTLVRAYLGYDRLDTVDQTVLLNHLYEKMWIYYNLFQPVMRLEEKIVTPIKGRHARIKRRFDEARTPFDRLSAVDILPKHKKLELEELRSSINPRCLRQEIYSLIAQLYELPVAAEGSTQDVFETLFQAPETMKGQAVSVTLSNDRTISVQ
jgi:hypothetical protein